MDSRLRSLGHIAGAGLAVATLSAGWLWTRLPRAQAAEVANPDGGPWAALASTPPGGPVVSTAKRPQPAEMPRIACSITQPTCVHASVALGEGPVAEVLGWAERAMAAYMALGLPRPLPDGDLGGGPAYDLYLSRSQRVPMTAADPRDPSFDWDQAHAFTMLPPPAPDAGCATGFEVARAIGQAICVGLDAAVEVGAAEMTASYLASVVAPCEPSERVAIDLFQRHPERSIFATEGASANGSLLFPWFLDDTYGRGDIGKVMLGVIALGGQHTPAGSWAWRNKPSVIDVLAATMKDHGSTFDSLLLQFAVSRAFVGDRSDGAHLAGTQRYGPSGRVRFEWAVPYGSLPRRLAPAAAIESTGATYLWVDLRGAPGGATLTFVADWEAPAFFRWAVVKVDAEGGERGRVDIAGIFGSSHVERTIVDMDGLAGLLIIGVNAGKADRSHPYHPDEEPLMPHSYTVTLGP